MTQRRPRLALPRLIFPRLTLPRLTFPRMVVVVIASAIALALVPFGALSNAAFVGKTTAGLTVHGEWAPTVTSQAVWWLDASLSTTLYSNTACTTVALTAVNSPIGCWRDRRGGSHVITVASGHNPPQVGQTLNARPSVNFGGGDLLLGADYLGGSSNSVTVFMVSRENTASNNMLLNLNGTAASTTRFSMHTPWGSNRVFFWDSGNATTERVSSAPNLVAVGQPALLVAWKDPVAAANYLRVNRQQSSGTLSVAGTTTGGLALGDLLAMISHDVMELLVFSTTLNATDRAAVENYLSKKWGVAP